MKTDNTTAIVCIQYYLSPCGELTLAATDNALCLCNWSRSPCIEQNTRRIRRHRQVDFIVKSSPILEQAKRQLSDYFAGRRKAFSIPLQPVGTDFQHRVWRALLDIPYGETRSYMQIAEAINHARGVRAVAQAIGANGIDILIPCHRVIGSNHALTGYAGGLDKKEFLLGLETS